MTAGPPGDDLPGERVLATYRGGLLRLTDRRVVYRGRGFSSRLRASLSLESVTAAGVARRGGNMNRFGIPIGLVFLGFLMAVAFESPEPLFIGALSAMASLPFVVFVTPIVIQIASGGYLLQVPVSRVHDEQARQFLAQLDAVRFSADAEQARKAADAAPSTQAYGAATPGVGQTTAGG